MGRPPRPRPTADTEQTHMKRFACMTLALAFVACSTADDPTSLPPGLTGTFALATYNGGALPAYLEPTLGQCSSMIAGGTLTADATGHVTFSRTYTTPCTKAAPNADARGGSLMVDGTAVTITLDANALNAAEVYTGTMSGGQMTLRFSVPNRSTPLVQTFVLTRQ